MTPFSASVRLSVALWSVVLLVALTACGDAVVAPGEGASAHVVITPGQARLAAVGDTARLRAGLYDDFGNSIAGAALTWTALDPDVFTIDRAGLVTGKQALSIGRAVASASGRADTAYVVVANPDVSPCLGYSAPLSLAVGQAISVSMTDAACITSAGGGDEYVVVPWHGSLVGWSTVALEVTGSGLATATSNPSLTPLATASSFVAARSGGRAATDPPRDLAFEHTLRERARRDMMPLARRARGAFEHRTSSGGLAAMIPAYLSVGDLVKLNANVSACESPVLRTGRVVATSLRAIVVADTGNPTGGFTDADYQRFAVAYDTLIAPVEDAAFGAPTDVDVNGKVLIFFTRAVNELTPTGAGSYIGGFFHARDLLPKTRYGVPYCPGSNEREMFYMLVPDVDGVVNGNKRSVGFVDSLTVGVLAHENQHLINFARRAYVNDALMDEEVWLNEGLSHIAEELVFYRAAGLAPRQNIGGGSFGTQPFDGLFDMYMAANFARLGLFLQAPQSFSPYSSPDDLGTRGAVWAFLRYAADHRGTSDGDVWMRLVNSQIGGFANLQDVFGPGILGMIQDWTLSVYADDYVSGVGAAYAQPSWNFRTAFPATPTSPQPYPLAPAIGVLSNDVAQTVALHGGSGAFFRFAVTAGEEAVVRVTSLGSVPPGTVRATIVRTR